MRRRIKYFLTAERETQTVVENARDTAELACDLALAGVEFNEIEGQYGGKALSFFLVWHNPGAATENIALSSYSFARKVDRETYTAAHYA